VEWATSAIDLGVVVKREAEAKMKTLSIFVVSQSSRYVQGLRWGQFLYQVKHAVLTSLMGNHHAAKFS
jgi:hypothetical protein